MWRSNDFFYTPVRGHGNFLVLLKNELRIKPELTCRLFPIKGYGSGSGSDIYPNSALDIGSGYISFLKLRIWIWYYIRKKWIWPILGKSPQNEMMLTVATHALLSHLFSPLSPQAIERGSKKCEWHLIQTRRVMLDAQIHYLPANNSMHYVPHTLSF